MGYALSVEKNSKNPRQAQSCAALQNVPISTGVISISLGHTQWIASMKGFQRKFMSLDLKIIYLQDNIGIFSSLLVFKISSKMGEKLLSFSPIPFSPNCISC